MSTSSTVSQARRAWSMRTAYISASASATASLKRFSGPRLLQRGEYLLLDDRPEASNFAKPSRREDAAEIVERAHLELIIQELDPLWPGPGDRRDLAELPSRSFFDDSSRSKCPVSDDAGDLSGEVLANAGELRQIGAGREHASDALRQRLTFSVMERRWPHACATAVSSTVTGISSPAHLARRPNRDHRLPRVHARLRAVDPFDEIAFLSLKCERLGAWARR